jgi:hypothetical protein
MPTNVKKTSNESGGNDHRSLGEVCAMFPLSPLENFMRVVYDEFDGDGAVCSVARVRGVIQRGPLEQALLLLQKRHPKLRARFGENRDGKPCFQIDESVPALPLQMKDFETGELPWQKEAIESFSAKLDVETGPLCKISVLRNVPESRCDILTTFHHAIIDGVSVQRFIDDLLTYYDKVANEPPGPSTVDALTEPLPFVSAQSPPLTSSWIHRSAMFIRLCGFLIRKRLGSWTSLPSDAVTWAPRWSRTVLSAEETEALLASCRDNGTTLYGLIFAAALSSLTAIMEDRPLRFACRCPINMRQVPGFEVSDLHLGCFVSGFDQVYTIRKTPSFWDLARRGRQDVQRFVEKQGPIMGLNLLRFLNMSSWRGGKRDTLGIDNLGVARVLGTYGDLTLEEISSVVANKNFGVSLMLLPCTLLGRLNITVGTVNVAEKFGQLFQERFFDTLSSVIGSGTRG